MAGEKIESGAVEDVPTDSPEITPSTGTLAEERFSTATAMQQRMNQVSLLAAGIDENQPMGMEINGFNLCQEIRNIKVVLKELLNILASA